MSSEFTANWNSYDSCSIKTMVEKMCSLYGEQIATVDGVTYYDFPTIDRLADAKVQSALEEAKFGYRAKFIQRTAAKILELGGLDWIKKLRELPYQEAKVELIQLPGVGAKVGLRFILLGFGCYLFLFV